MKFMYLKRRLKRRVAMVYSEGRWLSSHLGLDFSLSLCGPTPMTWTNAQINIIVLYPLIDYSNNEGFPCRKSPFTTMNHIFFYYYYQNLPNLQHFWKLRHSAALASSSIGHVSMRILEMVLLRDIPFTMRTWQRKTTELWIFQHLQQKKS